MKLVPDWKRVLTVGYSSWAFYLSVLWMFAPQISWSMFEFAVDPQFFGWSVVALLGLGLVGRVVEQGPEWKNVRRVFVIALALVFIMVGFKVHAMDEVQADLGPLTQIEAPSGGTDDEAAFRALSVDFIGGWEGKRNTAYLDVVGVPTICYGHTRTVTRADVVNRRTLTDQQCADLLWEEIQEYREQTHRYIVPEVLEVLPYRRDVAFTSLSFNVGWGAVGRSTAMRRLNRNDIPGACEALTWYNRAGGRVWPGLTNRRSAEEVLCLADFNFAWLLMSPLQQRLYLS